MSRTFGGVSTDAITTALTTHATLRSFAFWAYRTGDGGGSLGRIFDKRTSGGAQVELLLMDNDGVGASEFLYERDWAGGTLTAVAGMAPPSANAWHQFVVTYDAGSSANKPKMYMDGAEVTYQTQTAPGSGTVDTNTNAYVIGNRTSTANRNWAGDLCEFAVWDRILTASEAAALAKGFSPAFLPVSLVEYVPLLRNLTSAKNAAPTASGTVVSVHPRIIYPKSYFSTFVPSAGGILIKTIDGLAQASVKTYQGLASASVKTFNNLSNV